MDFTNEFEGSARVAELKGFSKVEPSFASEKIAYQICVSNLIIAIKF